MGQQHLTEQQFSSLDLDQRLLSALDKLDFHYCTPIQEKTLPLLLSGKDVSGQAQTGTGKTLAFLLACAQRILHSNATRYDCGQTTHADFGANARTGDSNPQRRRGTAGRFTAKLAICYGGKAYEQQKEAI